MSCLLPFFLSVPFIVLSFAVVYHCQWAMRSVLLLNYRAKRFNLTRAVTLVRGERQCCCQNNARVFFLLNNYRNWCVLVVYGENGCRALLLHWALTISRVADAMRWYQYEKRLFGEDRITFICRKETFLPFLECWRSLINWSDSTGAGETWMKWSCRCSTLLESTGTRIFHTHTQTEAEVNEHTMPTIFQWQYF